MQYGYDDNKNRIRPSFSGQKAKCPLCNGTIIGKCGEIYARHWQHHSDRECDPWQEHETDWHRAWKAKFPDDWQEIVIEKDGEKHIADVKTADGLVIEFQNSSISTTTIRIREDFYEDLIWVVNAQTFRSNFVRRSVVHSNLRGIDEEAAYQLSLLPNAYKEELKLVADEIEKNNRETIHRANLIDHKKEEIEKLNLLRQNHELFTNSVIEKWANGEPYWEYLTSDITNKIEPELKNQLHTIPSQINKLQADINGKEKTLRYILNLEDFQIDGRAFKIVEYGKIHSANFEDVRAISKLSRKTFFPEITEFKTEYEFKNFKHHIEQYDFAIDPRNAINLYKQKIKDDQTSIENLELTLPALRNEVAARLIQELESKIQGLERDLENLNSERNELIKVRSWLIERQAKTIAEKDRYVNETKVEIEKKKNDKRLKVMREKKGLYRFEWKHERKSWRAAFCTIYFDIGEPYLFELMRDGLLKKRDIRQFLEEHLSSKS